MKSSQLEFKWDEQPEPTAKVVGKGTAPLEELRTPEPPKEQVAEPVESSATTVAVHDSKPRWANYSPGHPWYYLPQGDNLPPLPAEQIPPGRDVGRFLESEVPKDPFKRFKKLRALLDSEQHDLQIDIERYQEISEKGVDSLSRYDREIAHGGNDELARASALALTFNHIAWSKGRIAWLEEELGKSAPTRGRGRRKRGG